MFNNENEQKPTELALNLQKHYFFFKKNKLLKCLLSIFYCLMIPKRDDKHYQVC